MLRLDAALPIEQQPNAALLRMCVWAEARGEGPKGMLAVACVIGNRAQATRREVGQIVLAPLQFSSFNPGDPNRAKLLTAWRDDESGWGQVHAVCTLWEQGVVEDVTMGATHYYNPAVCSPAWGRGHPMWQETMEYGNHRFGKAA